MEKFDPLNIETEATRSMNIPEMNPTSAAIGMLAVMAAFEPEAAMAKGGEYGIWEGRIVSLAHPSIMATMYGASAYAAFTGLQWRQLRGLGEQVSALKGEQKGYALTAAQVEEGASPNPKFTALQAQIDEISATRKELAGSDLRTKHYQVGSVILGLGTAFAIEGPVNTFLRAQKLFPGPHLYAGAGIVVAWAMAASLVPMMTKGSDAARYSHMAFNVLAFGLFTWQCVAQPPTTLCPLPWSCILSSTELPAPLALFLPPLPTLSLRHVSVASHATRAGFPPAGALRRRSSSSPSSRKLLCFSRYAQRSEHARRGRRRELSKHECPWPRCCRCCTPPHPRHVELEKEEGHSPLGLDLSDRAPH